MRFTLLFATLFAMSVPALAGQPSENEDVRTLVGRLSLEQFKGTIQGLTEFGDRRQGTKRNRDAIDWIEAQLEAVGCTTTERLDYVYEPEPRAGGGRPPETELNPSGGTPTGGLIGRNGSGPGGASLFGYRARTGVNTDPMAQPDEALRALNSEAATNGPRQEVYCTKIGATHPDEMYIIGAQAIDPVRALEQRGAGPERLTGLRRKAPGLAGKGGPARLGPLPRTPMDRDGAARHDAVRPWSAEGRRNGEPRSATGSRREHRVPIEFGAGLGLP
jgi:hypothetical protein